MAILMCQHCEYTKEVSGSYAGKTVKCPQCGKAAKVHDMTQLLTAYSDNLSQVQSELTELKQTMADCSTQLTPAQNPVPIQVSEAFTESFHKVFRENRIAMTEFNDAMKLRDMITTRSERITMYLIRFSFVGFFLLLSIILFLVWQFVENSERISTQLISINASISEVNHDLKTVQTDLSKVDFISENNQQTTESVNAIQTQVDNLNQKLSQTQVQVNGLSNQYNSLVYGPYR